MLEIISLCLSIDARAARIYSELANCAQDARLRDFWRTMAAEEKGHVKFWRQLRDSARRGMIPHIFKNSLQIKQDLLNIKNQVEDLLRQSRDCPNQATAFMLAFRTEFCFLHPVLSEFFHFADYGSENLSFEDQYQEHLFRFIKGLKTFGSSSVEMEMLSTTLEQLWSENRRLVAQNQTDNLTGLLNKQGILNAIVPLSYLAQRSGHNVGVLLMDLDYFKRVNDTYGHLIGDGVLKVVGRLIRDSIRKADLAGRFGGEEFLVYLSYVQHDHLFDVAEKIRSRVESECVCSLEHPIDHPITVSIGGAQEIFESPPDSTVITALIKKADDALYEAKRTGRNRTVIND